MTVSFVKFLNPCDACGIAKTTRVMFKGKIMTNMTVGSVWQTDISGKWATPSLQGNTYTIRFIERKLKKMFLYFSKSKDVFARTKNLMEAEIPKCRERKRAVLQGLRKSKTRCSTRARAKLPRDLHS